MLTFVIASILAIALVVSVTALLFSRDKVLSLRREKAILMKEAQLSFVSMSNQRDRINRLEEMIDNNDSFPAEEHKTLQ